MATLGKLRREEERKYGPLKRDLRDKVERASGRVRRSKSTAGDEKYVDTDTGSMYMREVRIHGEQRVSVLKRYRKAINAMKTGEQEDREAGDGDDDGKDSDDEDDGDDDDTVKPAGSNRNNSTSDGSSKPAAAAPPPPPPSPRCRLSRNQLRKINGLLVDLDEAIAKHEPEQLEIERRAQRRYSVSMHW